jgi:hypothetical protein
MRPNISAEYTKPGLRDRVRSPQEQSTTKSRSMLEAGLGMVLRKNGLALQFVLFRSFLHLFSSCESCESSETWCAFRASVLLSSFFCPCPFPITPFFPSGLSTPSTCLIAVHVPRCGTVQYTG